jgi:hypothetical protein
MAHRTPPRSGRLAPERTFVIQLRSDSDLSERTLCGRVEHVVSGDSERFGSLDALLAFIKRHLSKLMTESATEQEEV